MTIRFVAIAMLLTLSSLLKSQTVLFMHTACPEEVTEKLHYLRAEFGKNKSYPLEEELQILAALSFYPELKETKIEFRDGLIKTSLQARPDWYSLFKSRKNRKYLILTNHDVCNPVAPCNSDFDSQVGFYAHELGHIVDYETMTKRELIVCGVKYVFSSEYKKSIEQKTDLIAIQHGAGYLKYHASCFVFYKSEADPVYLERKKRLYFSPEEILKLTNQHFESANESESESLFAFPFVK